MIGNIKDILGYGETAEKRGAIVDKAQEIEDMIEKVKGMMKNIKDILGYGESTEKRDVDIVKVAEKIEAILEEIKNVFKSEEKRGVIVEHAKKVQAMIDEVKSMLTNIKDILGYGETTEK